MKTKNFLMAVMAICLFLVGLPIVVRYENVRIVQQYNLDKTEVTEFGWVTLNWTEKIS